MNSKNFVVGQEWKARNGDVHRVVKVDTEDELYPVKAEQITPDGKAVDYNGFTLTGNFFRSGEETSFDLLELIQAADAEVTKAAAERAADPTVAEPKTSSELTCAAPKDDNRSLVDSLIFNLAPAFVSNHRSGDEMMDFIKTVIDRRKEILA
jgi:hypothetical protein